jgi:molecular chaperone DnaJ
MPKRDLYRILGVPAQAAPGEIKRAYRRIAFSAHPDVGARPDPDRFREAREAYEVLSDPARRRSYDIEIARPRRPMSAEPLRARSPVTIVDDFLSIRPSIEEVLDRIGWNFFGYREKSGLRLRRLRVDAVLEVDEARFGCSVPFRLPAHARCETCDGTGDWMGLCPDCDGRGVVVGERELVLKILPGAPDGDKFEVNLSRVGIVDLLLEVRVIVS